MARRAPPAVGNANSTRGQLSSTFAPMRIDQTLACFEIARVAAETAGFNVPNFQILAVIRFTALGVGT
eukprot:1284189-Pyramimonas_sp.AAC.1